MPSLLHIAPPTTPSFTPLSFTKAKNAKTITRNYFVLSQSLTPSQHTILNFCFFQATNTNYIELSTNLIRRYGIFMRNYVKKADSNKNVMKRLNYRNVREDIISLINLHIFIQLIPGTNAYLLNPTYSHNKSPTGMSYMAHAFTEEYIGMCKDGNIDHIRLRYLAATYLMKSYDMRFKHTNYKRKVRKQPNGGLLRHERRTYERLKDEFGTV